LPVRQAGKVVSAAATDVVTHEATLGTTTWRRHRPTWMTSGMFAPTGTLPSENVPSTAVTVLTRGEPDAVALQLSHDTPGVNGCTP
jgi:hypothetical protein